MSTPHLIQTFLEIGLIAFALWAIFHESELADFERRLFKKTIKPCFKAVKNWIIGG